MNYTDNQVTTLPPETQHAQALRSVYIWVLVAVGLPGNLACLLTILSMHMTTATFYVALLAATDSVALVLKLICHQLISHQKMTAFSCYFHYTPSFVSCYSNWVLAFICFERFFAVCFPLKKQAYFTKKKVYISAIVLALALSVAFAPTFFLYKDANDTRNDCILRESMKVYKDEVWSAGLLTSLYFFIPFLLVAVFTTLIIIGLQRHRRARKAMMSTRTGSGVGNDGGVERALSIMLLCAGLVFLLLLLPACLYHLFLEKQFDKSVLEETAQAFLFYQIITVLSDASHAVNFIIYFLSAAKFRSCFVQLVKRCGRFAQCSKEPHCSDDAPNLPHVSHHNHNNDEGTDKNED